MKKEELIAFLLEANKAGYADANAKVTDQPDGAHEIIIKKDGWLFTDHWFGGDPFSGQESITKDGKAIWAMQYRGRVCKGFEDRADEVFGFLKQALGRCTPEEPLRGPNEYEDGGWRYENTWSHNLSEFEGVENIYYQGTLAHVCKYMGGVVDGFMFNAENEAS
ncbi:hypothetical protein EOL96_06510 [Candidatus Saccharibacteria bacterium]|jgi:hypothetical protein|nr:hypothetical protein [Candidatus Saccharibacteria bacterium]